MQRGITVRRGPRLGLGVAVALGGMLGGCVADSDDGGLMVMKNVAADDMCMVSPAETEKFISHGSLDLLLPSGYLFIAQMKSRITALDGQEDQRTIIVSHAKVDITFPNSQLFSDSELADLRTTGLTHFKQLFTAAVRPNGGLTDVGFELIPIELALKIATKTDPGKFFRVEALATFTIEGDMSGEMVSSQVFAYPVTIGNQVMVSIPGTCPLPHDFGMPRTGYACNAAQDGVIDCCMNGNVLRCPANVATM